MDQKKQAVNKKITLKDLRFVLELYHGEEMVDVRGIKSKKNCTEIKFVLPIGTTHGIVYDTLKKRKWYVLDHPCDNGPTCGHEHEITIQVD